MKIAIIGTHGVGKTTLAHKIAYERKLIGENVKLLGETARECPFPINNGQPPESVLWIYHRQMQKELEACAKYETVICDRSVLDSFMYAEAMGMLQDSHLLKSSLFSLHEWLPTYNEIYFVEKGSKEPSNDGIRDTDEDFQMKVQHVFEHYIPIFARRDEFEIHYVSADDIFN